MKKIIVILMALLSVCFLSQSMAATMSPPQAIVKQASDNLLHELMQSKADIKKAPKKTLFRIVKEKVLPYIDVDYMVTAVLGRAGHADWEKASPQLRQQFIDQFIILVVGTYSAALEQYNDQPVKVYPIRGFNPAQTTAKVHSRIFRNNGQPIEMLYRLNKEGDKWKVTDFSVEGISLVQSYQAQFQSIVSGQGLKGLIETLKKHNEQNND